MRKAIVVASTMTLMLTGSALDSLSTRGLEMAIIIMAVALASLIAVCRKEIREQDNA